jgi:hypothetical protein
MNIDKEIKKACDAYDKLESSHSASILFACVINCESEIKRLRKAIEEHKKSVDAGFSVYSKIDMKLWEVLK